MQCACSSGHAIYCEYDIMCNLRNWKLINCMSIVLENLKATQLVKKFPAFYGTLRCITVFIRARHWYIS
jgi:hypothetical protein